MFARTSRASNAARVRWWTGLVSVHGGSPWPVDVAKLRGAAARLKASGYRSAGQYLYSLKREHVARGHVWTGRLTMELVNCKRSCLRGIGPPKKAPPLDLVNWDAAKAYLPTALEAGASAVLVGCWWLMREIELAGMRRGDMEFSGGACGVATLNLPVSKSDPQAKGCLRSLGCACPSALCPVRAARVLWAHTDGLGDDAFVVRNLRGLPCTKQEVVQEIRQVARHTATRGWATGHTMRVTGAQRLAAAGIEESRIALFGRWGGATVRGYVREAALGRGGGGLAEQVEGRKVSCIDAFAARHADSPCTAPSQVEMFLNEVGRSPSRALSLEALEQEWLTFKNHWEQATSCSRLLPKYCVSQGGCVHVIANHRLTNCGWAWSSAGDIATSEDMVATCRKCSRRSTRWAGLSDPSV